MLAASVVTHVSIRCVSKVLTLCAIAVLAGCASPRLTPVQKFLQINPQYATNCAEVFEVPPDQWYDLEVSSGLLSLSGRASIWSGFRPATNEVAYKEREQFLSNVVEECDHRLMGTFSWLYEIRTRMKPGDRLLYWRSVSGGDQFYGRFFIVTPAGEIRDRPLIECTWGFANDEMWGELLRPRKE